MDAVKDMEVMGAACAYERMVENKTYVDRNLELICRPIVSFCSYGLASQRMEMISWSNGLSIVIVNANISNSNRNVLWFPISNFIHINDLTGIQTIWLSFNSNRRYSKFIYI